MSILNSLLMLHRKHAAKKWYDQFKAERQPIINEVVSHAHLFPEQQEEINFLANNGADYFPYDWALDKHINTIKGGTASFNGERLPYVFHNGKKLYMGVQPYSALLVEQMPHSPHRYFTNTFKPEKGDIFVDVGAAEGMISLDAVDIVQKLYLIERDSSWLNSLQRTFAPYSAKTTIINKYASDCNNDNNVTLDELLKYETAPILLKMDVEGMEDVVLAGATEILSRPTTKVAICTYHKSEDADRFIKQFHSMGYKTEQSEGYMFLMGQDGTYDFRKGMLRAWKPISE